MNSAKKLILIAAVSGLSVLTIGFAVGTMEDALAAPPPTSTPTGSSSQAAPNGPNSGGGLTVKVTNNTSEPVPVAPQGTTNVSGSVQVVNPATSPVPVAQQGAVSVSGTVGLSAGANTVKLDSAANTVKLDSNTVKIDPSNNTVKIDPAASMPVSGTVKIDSTGNTVKLDSNGSMAVSGTVGLDPAGNTVKLDPSTSTVGLSSSANTVKLDSTGNMVKLDPSTPITFGGTVGLSSDANTVKFDQTPDTTNNLVKIDDAYQNNHPVKVWGWTALSPDSNNPVNARNPIDPDTHQAVPLLVQVVGGSASEQPVQFHQEGPAGWTDAYTVPTGKRLKIEQISVYATTTNLWPQFHVKTTVGGVTVEHYLPRLEAEYVQQEGVNNQIFSSENYRVNVQVAMYADGGTVVQGAGAGSGTFRVSYSGYLVNQ